MFSVIVLTLGAAFVRGDLEAYRFKKEREAFERAWAFFLSDFRNAEAAGILRELGFDPDRVPEQLVHFDRMMESGELPPNFRYRHERVHRGMAYHVQTSGSSVKELTITLVVSTWRSWSKGEREDVGRALFHELEEMSQILASRLDEALGSRGLKYRTDGTYWYSGESGHAVQNISYIFYPKLETWEENGQHITGVRERWPPVPNELVQEIMRTSYEPLGARGVYNERPGWVFIDPPSP